MVLFVLIQDFMLQGLDAYVTCPPLDLATALLVSYKMTGLFEFPIVFTITYAGKLGPLH